jgi:hypothetical protein
LSWNLEFIKIRTIEAKSLLSILEGTPWVT